MIEDKKEKEKSSLFIGH